MKIISDIRLFKSNVENIDGYTPSYIDTKEILPILKRVVMKLREHNFSLGDCTHLYINFTTCLPEGTMLLANRTVIREDSWFKFYDVGVSAEFIEQMEIHKCYDAALELIKNVLLLYYIREQDDLEIICSSFEIAVKQGEQMLMKFKEKKSAKNHAIIYLRYLDTHKFLPLLRVYDNQNNLILVKDLPASAELNHLGTIQLSSKRVTIKPRQNIFAKDLKPITYELYKEY